jgi:hypothetical protein
MMRWLFLVAALSFAGVIAAGCGSSATPGGSDAGGSDANPPACPGAIPPSGGSCHSVGLHCSYGCGSTASCDGHAWTVFGSRLDCDGGVLPDGQTTCSKDAQCKFGYQCSSGGIATGCGICVMPMDPCSTDSDCKLIHDAAPAMPMVCAPAGSCVCPVGGKSGSCIAACQSAADCGPEEACDTASGHCGPKPCNSDSECPSESTIDFACASGVCGPKACTTDVDCGAHFCVNGTCYPKPGSCTPPAA